MIDYEEADKMLEELYPYIELEGTELGEAWGLLTQIHGRADYLSEIFKKEIRKEIKRQLKHVKKHAKITKEVVTTKHTVRDLDWDW